MIGDLDFFTVLVYFYVTMPIWVIAYIYFIRGTYVGDWKNDYYSSEWRYYYLNSVNTNILIVSTIIVIEAFLWWYVTPYYDLIYLNNTLIIFIMAVIRFFYVVFCACFVYYHLPDDV